MRKLWSVAFSKKGPPSDTELYDNLDASYLTFIEYVSTQYLDSENLLTVNRLSEDEFQIIYRYILDAALSSLSHPNRGEFARELMQLVVEDFRARNSDVLALDYLPPVMPPKYCGWIQGLLNENFPINVDIVNLDIDTLYYLISQAMMQGSPPRKYEQLSSFEKNFVVMLAGATFMGLRKAAAIKGFRKHSNRHLAQILALSHILGIKFSVENNLN